jgi:hypothetical protein
MVEFTAVSIMKCDLSVGSGATHPGATAVWAVSRSRALVPTYAGPWDSVIGGRVDVLYDQSGHGRDLSASISSARPIATTSGPNSRACCDFSPSGSSVGHLLQGDVGDPVSELLTASAGYIVISIRPDAVSQDTPTAHLNAGLLNWGPFGAVAGLSVQSGGILYAYNNDGSEDKAASALAAVPIGVGNPCVVEWRHDGGNIYQRINGANETFVSSGNTTDLTEPIRMGFGGITGTFYNGKVFEAMIYSTVPTQAERDAVVSDMMIWVGA